MLPFFNNMKWSRLKLKSCLLIIFLSLNGQAQAKTNKFSVDYAHFRLKNDYLYLEVYYSIQRKNLVYQGNNAGYDAAASIITSIYSLDTLISRDQLTIRDSIKSRDEILPSHKFAEASFFNLKAGSYILISEFNDLKSQETDTFKDSLVLKSFPDSDLTMSPIQLAASIMVQKEIEGKFDKNGLRVIPNAELTYGTGLMNLSYYAEAYNLADEGEAEGSSYRLRYSILDLQGNILMDVPGRPKIKPGNSSVIYGKIPINDLVTGIYVFNLKFTDDFTGKSVDRKKAFNVFKKEDLLSKIALAPSPDPSRVETSEYESMDELSLDAYFEKLKYITSKQEQGIFKELNLTGKRNFLFNFWEEKDPDPNTAVNERKRDYYNLLEYADQNFTRGVKPGWSSDRGRILLTYGKPDQIEKTEANLETRAYQIWYYYQLEGGVEFVFVDRRRFGDFELVHSTLRTEIQDYDWQTHYARP